MKKALVILLILAVAGGLFAQVTITGEIKTGIGALITDGTDEVPQIGIRSRDADAALRVDVIGNYTNEEETVGAVFRLRTNTGSVTGAPAVAGTNYGFNTWGAPTVSFQRAYGWLKAFDGLFTLHGGWLDTSYNDRFGTQGGIDTSFDIGRGVGLFGVITPIPGFDIGVSAFGSGNYDRPLEYGRYHFAFAYTAPELLHVTAQLRLNSNFGYNSPEVLAAKDDAGKQDALFGVKILALQSILPILRIDAAFLDFGKDHTYVLGEKASIFQLGQRVQFKAGDLTLDGRFMQQFAMFDDNTPKGYVPDLTFGAWVAYAMGSIVPRFDVYYNMGSSRIGFDSATMSFASNATSIYNADYRMWDGIRKGQFYEDYSNLQIRPSVQFRFDGTTDRNFIELGYALFADLSKDAKDWKGTSWSPTLLGTGRTMTHNIYVEYKVSF